LSDFKYLTLDDAIELVQFLDIGPIRDVGLLDSALARPRSSAFGQDAYGSIELKASALLQSLTKNLALVDGNKRLAWVTTISFLTLNGCTSALSNNDGFELMWELAGGSLELEEIARRLSVTRDLGTH
jgi:death-on-curing protein